MNYPHNMLMRVEKPARYTGNEINSVSKTLADVRLRFALCFPDVYEVGMSWTGLDILYFMLNAIDGVYCERSFAPWSDMEAVLRESGIPLTTLETGAPLSEMDIVGFTLQHEMCYTNILNMLDLSGINFLSAERGEASPVICAGGPCACNPEPLADFIDFFYIGEAEACLGQVADIFLENKKHGGSKEAFLEKICSLPGIYVPKFYDVKYNADGVIENFIPNREFAPKKITKAAVSDLDRVFMPDRQIVPNLEAVHDRVALEVFRGCIRGCRFCQAGYVYRPMREKSTDVLINCAEKMLKNTGYDEISLLSLSTGDYSDFPTLAGKLTALEKNVSLSLPSLRVDAFSLELADKISGSRKSGLTFAPEAGSQRMRNIINKNLTEDEILDGCGLAFSGGWGRVKLYFMLGLPFETEEDVEAIAGVAEKIVGKYFSLPKEKRSRDFSVTLSASCFVPKPHTPFQFVPQDSLETLSQKQRLLKKSITKRQIKFNYHNADTSAVEGALSRGDRRTGNAILAAFRLGARFDSWTERFNYAVWLEAFRLCGLDMQFYSGRERDYGEILPWDHIDMGVSRDFLINEMEKAKRCETTPDCRTGCSGCGAAGLAGGADRSVCRE